MRGGGFGAVWLYGTTHKSRDRRRSNSLRNGWELPPSSPPPLPCSFSILLLPPPKTTAAHLLSFLFFLLFFLPCPFSCNASRGKWRWLEEEEEGEERSPHCAAAAAAEGRRFSRCRRRRKEEEDETSLSFPCCSLFPYANFLSSPCREGLHRVSWKAYYSECVLLWEGL